MLKKQLSKHPRRRRLMPTRLQKRWKSSKKRIEMIQEKIKNETSARRNILKRIRNRNGKRLLHRPLAPTTGASKPQKGESGGRRSAYSREGAPQRIGAETRANRGATQGSVATGIADEVAYAKIPLYCARSYQAPSRNSRNPPIMKIKGLKSPLSTGVAVTSKNQSYSERLQ